jgi:hypothetical protein
MDCFNLQINIVQTTQTVCNATGPNGQLNDRIGQLAVFTGGDLYITDDTANVSPSL